MAGQKVADAMAGVPELSSFVGLINSANYTDTFNNATDVTVFAPVNAAFAKSGPPPTDQNKVIALLGYHVVQGRKTPADLADATLPTTQTGSITTKASGDTIKINGTATVICANIQTANANLYLIDTVLTPPS
ncbi:fasciclin domain-containing protein [Nonomuraea longicatena]|uniref:FAS1 domain-containing protein n=1 Tax=Nonomuraea longicatena TaxID=83682 RepID=A0ABN1NTC8_9ACTN